MNQWNFTADSIRSVQQMLMLMLTQHYLPCCFTLKALMDAFIVENKRKYVLFFYDNSNTTVNLNRLEAEGSAVGAVRTHMKVVLITD